MKKTTDMTTLTLETENTGRLRIIEFMAKILFIPFTKAEKEYSPEFLKKIERGRADYEAGRCTKIEPSDVWK